MSKNLRDKFNRKISYLRVSVTDRCNFRCRYCMPDKSMKFIEKENLLTDDDILFAVEIFSRLGVEKVRITGGEPLVRPGITELIAKIRKIEAIKEMTLTTNGSLLAKHAKGLYDAGLNRINVSLDSLKDSRYKEITGGFTLKDIIEGIQKAKEVGLRPIKTNTVLIKGFNDDEILDFCEFAAKVDIVTRFIEFMPVGNFCEWQKGQALYGEEVLNIIKSKYDAELLQRKNFEGPAQNYKLSNGARVGIITPISNHFCADCDKLRLTSEGKLRPCLLSDKEIDLSTHIKNKDEKALIEAIADGLDLKDKEHSVVKDKRDGEFKRTMSKIGG